MLKGFTMSRSSMAKLFSSSIARKGLSLNKFSYSNTRNCSNFGYWDPAQFKPKKAVILTKVVKQTNSDRGS